MRMIQGVHVAPGRPPECAARAVLDPKRSVARGLRHSHTRCGGGEPRVHRRAARGALGACDGTERGRTVPGDQGARADHGG
jgi:hypothetical protein